MATSSSEQKKPDSKISQILPSNYHLSEKLYCGWVRIGATSHYTEWFDSKEEAELELRCLEKNLSYELIETIEGEGYYPERAKVIEEKYQASGRTNGLYTGLMLESA